MKFKDMKRVGDPGHLYFHYTCATDTGNIQMVFNVVEKTIVKKIFEEMGMNWRQWSTFFPPFAYSNDLFWCINIIFFNAN